MKRPNIYLAILFLAASLIFVQPGVSYAQITTDVSGQVTLNCPAGYGAKAQWFLNGPGTLGSIWYWVSSSTGQTSPIPRSYSVGARGYLAASIPPRAGYRLRSMGWSFNGSAGGYLVTAYCTAAV